MKASGPAPRRCPAVRVGIVTRNRAESLPRAIRSALSQSYRNTEVVVLDDGSDDSTPALRSRFPLVEWRRFEGSRGYIEGRNELMRAPGADYYISIDDDAWFVNEDEIATAVDYLEANAGVAALAFDILSPDRPHSRPRSTPRPIHMFIGCGHVLRTSAVASAGFYTASPGAYGSEEKDLCVRLLDKGWDVRLVPGVHVWHDKAAVARNQRAQHRSGVCNDLAFALRRCPLPMLFGIFPIKLFNHIRFSIAHKLLKPCIAGIGLFSRHALQVWQDRKPVRSRTFREFIRRSRCAA
jgi:GT2 family glycosyltransferase